MGITKRFGFLWLMVFLIPLVWAPILFSGVGIYDWDHVLQRYAAIYQTYVKYGQFPGNNIWAGGGMPLVQTYPGYGLFTALALLAGPSIGIHLGLAVYYILGYFGAIKLANIFTKEESTQVYFALYIVFGNAIAYHLAVGHTIFANILILPYLLYFTINYRKRYSGIFSGVLFGFSNLDGFAYTNQYIAIILIIFIIWRFIIDLNSRKNIINFTIFLMLGFFSVATYKIISILPLLNDFPRFVSGVTNYALTDWLRFSFVPRTGLYNVNVGSNHCAGTWENGNYLGLSALILLLLVTFKKTKIIFPVLLILIFSFSNDTNWYSFNYYLKMLPSFSSHLCTTRLRVISPIVVGLAILIIYKDEKEINFFKLKILKNTALLLMALEVFIVSALILLKSHIYINEKPVTEWNKEFRSYVKLPLGVSDLYSATMSNIGVSSETESYISYSPVKDPALFEILNRTAEFTQGETQITPTYWSPNKIIFNTNDLDNCISTKIHKSNLWNINGSAIFKDKRIYESGELICGYPDQGGRLELEYKSPWESIALAINLIIIIITLFLLVIRWRFKDYEFKVKAREYLRSY